MTELDFPRAHSPMECLQTWYRQNKLAGFILNTPPAWDPQGITPSCQKEATQYCLHGSWLSVTSMLSNIKIFFFPVLFQRANFSQLSHWEESDSSPPVSRNLPGYKKWARSATHGTGAPSVPVFPAAEFGDHGCPLWLGGWEVLPSLYSSQRTKAIG